MDSLRTHYLIKRGVVLQPSLLAVIIAAVVAINVIILVGWCILKRRRRVKKKKKGSLASSESLESGDFKEKIKTFTPLPAKSSQAAARRKDRSGVRGDPKAKLSKTRRPRVEEVKDTHSRAMSIDTETASIYSAASAPLEFHEQLFRTQPFSLDPSAPAAAPRWVVPQEPPRALLYDYPTAPLSILQSLMPYGPPQQPPGEPETISQLIRQVDELNHLPPSRTSSEGYSATIATASSLVSPPAITHLRSDSASGAIPPHSIAVPDISISYYPGESRSSTAVATTKVSPFQGDFIVGSPTEAIPADAVAEGQTQDENRAAQQRLAPPPRPPRAPRVVWKQQ